MKIQLDLIMTIFNNNAVSNQSLSIRLNSLIIKVYNFRMFWMFAKFLYFCLST